MSVWGENRSTTRPVRRWNIRTPMCGSTGTPCLGRWRTRHGPTAVRGGPTSCEISPTARRHVSPWLHRPPLKSTTRRFSAGHLARRKPLAYGPGTGIWSNALRVVLVALRSATNCSNVPIVLIPTIGRTNWRYGPAFRLLTRNGTPSAGNCRSVGEGGEAGVGERRRRMGHRPAALR